MIWHLMRARVNDGWSMAGSAAFVDHHEVRDDFGRRAAEFLGMCDSCGRWIIRGAGRWWEWDQGEL